jgi:glutamate racemase
MSEEALKRKKDNSMVEEREALESLEGYYSVVSTGRTIESDDLLHQVKKIGLTINVHKQASENYIKYLEDQVNKFRKGNFSSL